MDNVLDDLVRVARRCERTAKAFEIGPVEADWQRLVETCATVGESWCGSYMGYHANVYTQGLTPRRPGEHFDSIYGPTHFSDTTGRWAEYDPKAVEAEILRKAGVQDLDQIREAARGIGEVFEEVHLRLLATLDAVLASTDDTVIQDKRRELSELTSHISRSDFASILIPSGKYISSDMRAVTGGLRLPPHLGLQAWLMEQKSYAQQSAKMAKIVRHLVVYLVQRHKMRGKSVAKTDGKIFIGHGHSLVWRDLKDFIQDRLKLDWDEFNREPTAGQSTKERLEGMLDNACFAFLVMTAEDEVGEGKKQARANVIHEVGLFQGRLGFERAIVLLEEGCEEFSNIVGLSQIRFPKGNVMAKTEEIRRVLEREQIVKS